MHVVMGVMGKNPHGYSYLLTPQVVNNLSVWSWVMFSDRVGNPIALAYIALRMSLHSWAFYPF